MKSNQKLTVLFWHRKSKADASGHAPIICRISIDGNDEEFSIGRKASLKDWDAESKKVTGGLEYKKTNLKIAQISADLERHFTVLQLEHEHITPLMLKNVYHGLPAEHKKGAPKPEAPKCTTLLQMADMQIKEFSIMVDKKLRSNETLKQWRSTRKKIVEFIRFEYGQDDLDISCIDYSFATKFYKYLTVDRKKILQEAAAKKQLKNTKQLLTLAESNNLLGKNPIQKFRCGGDETDVPPLEFYEVNLIWRKDFAIQRLVEVKDVFIFQCFTGFAFQDVYALTEHNIFRVGLNGERWLIKDRGKTGVSEMVPIMPIVEEIIEKYKEHPCRTVQGLLLPVNSNARYNGYLKEIAVIAGINRELNTHLARHTFADIMLNIFGFSLEEVSKMLGHRNIRTTQRYAKVRKNKISHTWSKVRNIGFTEDGQLRQVIVQ